MSPPGHHHPPRFPNIGQKETKEVKIPAPMCPETEKAMIDWYVKTFMELIYHCL